MICRLSLISLVSLSVLTIGWDGMAADKAGLARGDEAPAFVLKTINAKAAGTKLVAVRRHVGAGADQPKKALVLSFAASYCEPCKKELAEIRAHVPKMEAAGVLFAAVVIDREPEGIAAMKALTVDELKLKFPVLLDRFGIVAKRYRAETLPMVVIIGADGNVRWISTGFKEDSISKLMAELGLKA